jgi:hypothetical protein
MDVLPEFGLALGWAEHLILVTPLSADITYHLVVNFKACLNIRIILFPYFPSQWHGIHVQYGRYFVIFFKRIFMHPSM